MLEASSDGKRRTLPLHESEQPQALEPLVLIDNRRFSPIHSSNWQPEHHSTPARVLEKFVKDHLNRSINVQLI